MILDRVIELDRNVNPVNRKKLKILGDMYHLTMGLINVGYAKNVMKNVTTDDLTTTTYSGKYRN